MNIIKEAILMNSDEMNIWKNGKMENGRFWFID